MLNIISSRVAHHSRRSIWCLSFGCWLLVATPALAFNVQRYVPEGRVIGSFLGPHGWRGFITENLKGIRVIIWQAPDGLVVVGKVMDANARDLSQLAQQKYQTNEIAVSVLSKVGVESHSLSSSDNEAVNVVAQVYTELQKLDDGYYTKVAPVAQQTAKQSRELYVFYDYECPYCAAALHDIEHAGLPALVYWLPVAILGGASATYGAGVLDGDVPLKQIANTKVVQHPQPTAASLDAVAHNTSLLKAMQKRASTPTFVYRTEEGKVVTLSGYSPSVKNALQQMLKSE